LTAFIDHIKFLSLTLQGVNFMRIKTFLSTGLITLLGVSFLTPVYALDAPGQDGAGNIYITGGTAGQKYTALYLGLKKKVTKTADECGIVKVTGYKPQPDTPSGWPKFDSASLSGVQDVNSGSIPKCVNGVAQLPGNQNGTFRMYVVADDSYTYYFTGKTPFAKYDFESGDAVARKVTADRCGMVKLSATNEYANYTGGISVEYGAVTATLPITAKTSTAGPACKYGTLLKPAGW
jgi:hypothetical protein